MKFSERIPISKAFKEKRPTVAAWVQDYRSLKNVKFIILRDATGTLQVTIPKSNPNFKFEVTKESYIIVKGKMVDNNVARGGKELIPEEIEVINSSDQPLPIDISNKIETSLSKRLDWRFIDLRREGVIPIFKLESEIVRALEDFVTSKGFVRIFPSAIVDSPTEGGTNYFKIDYFDKQAYLAQSPQFYKELSLLGGLEKVYAVMPVFRAEPHFTSRHLCEYTSFDVEMVTDDMMELIELETEMLIHLNNHLKKVSLPSFNIGKPIYITFKEAKEIAEQKGVNVLDDLNSEAERVIGEWAAKKGTDMVYVGMYPFKEKPFYAKKVDDELAWSFDLIFKGVELTTGGLREHRYEQRRKNAIEHGINPDQFDHFRFFKYGMPPHGGFAIGVERLVMQIMNLQNIREASLTPRDPERLTP